MGRFVYEEEDVVSTTTGNDDKRSEQDEVVKSHCRSNHEIVVIQRDNNPAAVFPSCGNEHHYRMPIHDAVDNDHNFMNIDERYSQHHIRNNIMRSRTMSPHRMKNNNHFSTQSVRAHYPCNDPYNSHEIHPYHYSSCRENESSYRLQRNLRKKQYIKHCFLLLLLLLLQRYIPPPPPPNQSWNEFVSSSTDNALSTIQHLILLTSYITSGFVYNLYGDLKENFIFSNLMSRIISGHKDKFDLGDKLKCSLSIPLSDKINPNKESLTDFFTSKITGQDDAIRLLIDTLIKWNLQRENNNNENDNDTDSTDPQSQKGPLSLVLSGPKGVGKYETAKRLAQLLLSQCQENFNYFPQNIITLHGIDYALDNTNTNHDDKLNGQDYKSIVSKILHHIHQLQGSGTVIIIKHIENIATNQRDELFRLWSKSSVNFQPLSPTHHTLIKQSKEHYHRWKYHSVYNDSSSIDDKDQNIIRVNLDNVAFIATTDVGVNKLFEVILKSDGIHDSSSYQEISRAVHKEIEESLGNPILNGIAPFLPLRYWEMEHVVHKQCHHQLSNNKHRFSHIQIHESAARHLINPKRINYFEMQLDQGSYLFSKNGAHNLALCKQILDQIDEIIASNTFHSENDTVFVQYDVEHGFIMRLCHYLSVNNNETKCSSQYWNLSL